ncbi:hypothetical protein BUALT_Bualt14G0058800 [Buddleja alternifolia]|uniref:DUF295 domain-containing protein n=1 Tax=Buddleja alternifolia TaxID=168488 RepID=A0AAV6WI51_9LAMI|nr:hypothetical protein BUALT_Bualt14G0058800 [Buddleja alternifolia]
MKEAAAVSRKKEATAMVEGLATLIHSSTVVVSPCLEKNFNNVTWQKWTEKYGVFMSRWTEAFVLRTRFGKKMFDKLGYEYDMKWVTLGSLGKKCFYVGPNGSFAETCNVKGMANTIYFNKFHDCSGVLYSISTGEYHSIDEEYTSGDSHKLTETGNNSTWIKPPRST